MAKRTDLTSLLTLVESPATSPVEYVIGGATLSESDRAEAAHALADDSMSIACGNAPALARWRARRDGGPRHTIPHQLSVETFASIAFGLPAKPKETDHVQGHVAELLWNRLIQERTCCRDGRILVRAHPIKIDALEPGGDGFVIYRDAAGNLVFRLWEIKKHSAKNPVSATINRASVQLLSRGHEYLAKLSGPESMAGGDAAISGLYADMIDLWFGRSERAGVGVSVGTSHDCAPQGPASFRSIRTQFPEFTEPSQTESIVVTVPDFPGFAEQVKEIVWSGL